MADSLNNVINLPTAGTRRFERETVMALSRIRAALGAGSNPSFGTITLQDATASRLVNTDADGVLTSVTDLTAWVAGTANEVSVADDGDGTITVGLVDPVIVGKGGTGAASLTDHSILLGSGTDPVTALGAATNGQLPIGSTGADPALATLTGTADEIAVTNGAGSITLALDGNIGDLAALTPTDGNFIVGNGSTWVAESGDTARTSLGLGTGDSPTLTGLTLSGLTQGSVLFAGASGALSQDNSNFFWDNSNNRLGIGINTPSYSLHCVDNNAGGGWFLDNDTYGYMAWYARWSEFDLVHYETGSSSSCAVMDTKRARGTQDSPLTCQDNDWIAKWRFYQHNGSAFEQLGGFIYDIPDVSDDTGRFNFYYYSSGAHYILSASKDAVKLGDADGTDYVNVDPATGDLSFAGSASFLPPRVSQSAQPTPDTGALQVWRDPDDNKTYLIYNDTDEGVRKVELT